MKTSLYALTVALCILFTACEPSTVNQVKNGTFDGRETLTVGQAFEKTFGNGKWSSFDANTGHKVVEFSGTTDDEFMFFIVKNILSEVDVNTLEGRFACSMLQFPRHAESKYLENYYKNNYNAINDCYLSLLSGLPAPGAIFKVQFLEHVNNDKFEIGFFGFTDSTYSIDAVINNMEFLDFVYSNHVYKKSGYKGRPECDKSNNGAYFANEFVCEDGTWRNATASEFVNGAACVKDGEEKIFEGDAYVCQKSSHEWVLKCDKSNNGTYFASKSVVCEDGSLRDATVSEFVNGAACVKDGEEKTFEGDTYICQKSSHEWVLKD